MLLARRDGVTLTLLLLTLTALVAVWSHSAGYFLDESPFGQQSTSAHEQGGQVFSDEPWWPSIVAFHLDDETMQVETSLADDDHATCNQIYERIWMQPGFLATWHIGRLLVFDQHDNLMCGGKA